MADQYSLTDPNQNHSLMGASGTAGTAETRRLLVDDLGYLQTKSGFIDTSGSVNGYINNAGAPQICAQPYLQALAEGDIPGHVGWMKIGFTPSMGTGESDVWSYGGVINYPQAGTQMAVLSSDNTSDTSGGAGARSMSIYYLDSNYAQGTTTVTLNGTAPVNTTPIDIYRVNGFRVNTAGTAGKAVGNITLRAAAGTTVYSYITAGYTRARNSAYTVPAGKTLYIVQFTLGFGYAANQTHYCRLYTKATQNEGTLTPGIFYPFTEIICANQSTPIILEIPSKIGEKVDLKVSGIASTSGIAMCSLRGWLE
jgi:hypothetical protein